MGSLKQAGRRERLGGGTTPRLCVGARVSASARERAVSVGLRREERCF